MVEDFDVSAGAVGNSVTDGRIPFDPRIGLNVGELVEDCSVEVRDVGVTMTAGMLPVDANRGLNCGLLLDPEMLSSSALSVDEGLGNADRLLMFES